MKVEVLKTLKGGIGELFAKGTIFVSPDIPQTILEEIGAKRGTIRVLEADMVMPEIKPTVDPPVDAPISIAVPEVTPIPSKKHPRMKR